MILPERNKMKKVLILGAGIYQVPLIKTAKKLGIYSIVVSIPGNYPGFELADKVYYENTTDYAKILEIAQEEKIDGIVTAGTDVAVITIGKVCDKLGLTGLSEEAAKIATDKLRMKEVYEEYGVRTARYRKIYFDNENYASDIAELTLPVMFKSVDSSGSRGIRKVNSPEEFDDAREYVRANTRSDYFIVEEFIAGEEFGAQAFVRNGEVKFILPHGDYVFTGDTGVPVGHFAPYDLSEDIIADAEKQLVGAIRAMKLDNCAINADFIMRDGKTYVLEIGGRSGATCLAELTAIYYDFDYYEKILLTALGEDVDFTPGPLAANGGVPNASKLLMSDRDGHIVSQEDSNPADPDIVEVQFDYKPGDEVHKFRVGPHRIGHVICKGETLDAAVAKLDEALSRVKITVE
jgi:biotin carboxylase